ncbi:MAG TPA: alpha/beta hydrolase family protein [Kofleriaceae bacterium]|jgi:S-formylglutathione hydrolase FrmB
MQRWLILLSFAAGCMHPSVRAPVSRSRVEYVVHHSTVLGVDKAFLVYIPAGYDAVPDVRWPVFYYLHGITSPETEWVRLGKLDQAADRLALRAIVVMPDADDSFYIDSRMPIDFDACLKSGDGLLDPSADRDATCVHARAYESYVTQELVADVDARYRTNTARDGRAIAGVSMGGYGALSIALRHPDQYAAAASHSGVATLLYDGPHPFAPGQVRVATSLDRATGADRLRPWMRLVFGDDLSTWTAHDPAALIENLPPGMRLPALYLDVGTEDFIVDLTRFLDELLTRHNIPHTIFYGPGEHSYDFWTARLPASLTFLSEHTTVAR